MRNSEIVVRFVEHFRVFGEGDEASVVANVIDITKNQRLKVKGKVHPDAWISGAKYLLTGRWTTYRGEDQFSFSSWGEEEPTDAESVAAYLAHVGKPAGITSRVAGILGDKFGEKAIELVINDPGAAFDAVKAAMGSYCRWTREKAEQAATLMERREGQRKARLALTKMLNGRGFRKTLVDKLLDSLGSGAVKLIRDDPYYLMQFSGVGFLKADKLFCDLAREEAMKMPAAQASAFLREQFGSLRRMAMALVHIVSIDRTGSTWVQLSAVQSGVQALISQPANSFDSALRVAQDRGAVRLSTDGRWVALARHAADEDVVRLAAKEMVAEKGRAWPRIEDIQNVTDHQRAAIQTALQFRLGLIAGSPGCGKTWCVSAIVEAIAKTVGGNLIAVACPTGKAAVRATAALAERGLRVSASTIHRLLVVTKADENDGFGFFYNRNEPLPCQYLIIDEPSMIDTSLMARLLEAVSPDCHVLMCGDGDQLPPVGHGKPFVDLQTFVPTGRLTKIERNNGLIVQACAAIRDRRPFCPSHSYNEESGENLVWIEATDDEQQHAILNIVSQIRDGEGCDPVWDVQVLCSLNADSTVSRATLNPMLQQLLNPDGRRHDGLPFRIGDKLVCLKNGFHWLTPEFVQRMRHSDVRREEVSGGEVWHLPLQSGGETALFVKYGADGNPSVSVANGELCELVGIETGKMVIRLFDPEREVTVPWRYLSHEEKMAMAAAETDGANAGDFDLGYALSVHKSQGSQWKYAIFAVDANRRAANVLNRNAIYTAISRPTNACFCVGQLRVARDACMRDALSLRKTLLGCSDQSVVGPACNATVPVSGPGIRFLDAIKGVQ